MRKTHPLGKHIPGLGRSLKVRWGEVAWDEEDVPQALKEKLQLTPASFSDPPPGFCRVVGFYVNPTTGKLLVLWDDTPVS